VRGRDDLLLAVTDRHAPDHLDALNPAPAAHVGRISVDDVTGQQLVADGQDQPADALRGRRGTRHGDSLRGHFVEGQTAGTLYTC